jgi:hypothetical protein
MLLPYWIKMMIGFVTLKNYLILHMIGVNFYVCHRLKSARAFLTCLKLKAYFCEPKLFDNLQQFFHKDRGKSYLHKEMELKVFVA